MQIVSIEDNLHEISKILFLGKIENIHVLKMSSAFILPSMQSIKECSKLGVFNFSLSDEDECKAYFCENPSVDPCA